MSSVDDLWQQVLHGAVQPDLPQQPTTAAAHYGTPVQPDLPQQLAKPSPERLNPGDRIVLVALKEDEIVLAPVAEDIITLKPLED